MIQLYLSDCYVAHYFVDIYCVHLYLLKQMTVKQFSPAKNFEDVVISFLNGYSVFSLKMNYLTAKY